MTDIRERTAAATSVGQRANYNSWPDRFEIVRHHRYDISIPSVAYEAGQLMGKAFALGELRQIDGENIPESGTQQKLMNVWFVVKPPAGQIDDESKRNILAMWEHRVWTPDKNDFTTKVHIIELGCSHTYDTAGSRENYGYHKGKCTKCGHRFVCDSGD